MPSTWCPYFVLTMAKGKMGLTMFNYDQFDKKCFQNEKWPTAIQNPPPKKQTLEDKKKNILPAPQKTNFDCNENITQQIFSPAAKNVAHQKLRVVLRATSPAATVT